MGKDLKPTRVPAELKMILQNVLSTQLQFAMRPRPRWST